VSQSIICYVYKLNFELIKIATVVNILITLINIMRKSRKVTKASRRRRGLGQMRDAHADPSIAARKGCNSHRI